jgi:hypothetical protein
MPTFGHISPFSIHNIYLYCHGVGSCSLQCFRRKHGTLQNVASGYRPELLARVVDRTGASNGRWISFTKLLHNHIQKTSKRQNVLGQLLPLRDHHSLLFTGIYFRSHSSRVYTTSWAVDPFGDSLLLLLLEFLQQV